MRSETLYYVDGIKTPYHTADDALRVEKAIEENRKRREYNDTVEAIHIKLKFDLDQAMNIPYENSSFTVEGQKIANLAVVCKKFIEQHKEYSKY